MLHLRYHDTALVESDRFLAFVESVDDYREHLAQVVKDRQADALEASLLLPEDDAYAQASYEVVEALRTPELKYVFVVGIGGSNLGTKAIFDALHMHESAFGFLSGPELLFSDTPDPTQLKAQVRLIEERVHTPEEVAIVVISKSGGTTETIFNAETLLAALAEKFQTVPKERVAVITDEGSKLWQAAEARGFLKAAVPEAVGGRFSVLSAVGLIPLALAGVDVEELRRGAADMLAVSLLDSDDNLARASAAVLCASLESGKSIHDTFTFLPQLYSSGLWYRQLMGESVGKAYDLDGDLVHTGMTPTVSIGSTDLHSVAQLYLGGPRDKITTFLSLTNEADSLATPQKRVFPDLVPMINGRSAEEVMSAIYEGTKIAYQKNQLPFMEMVFEEISAYSLGAWLQSKMVEMMYLGHLLNVNTFDQPNVESYKVETKKILEG